MTLENGKDVEDAAGEVRRGIEVVEFACGMPTLMMGETVRDVARGIDNVLLALPSGGGRGDNALQLPLHGAPVDHPRRHRGRQHLHPQAFGENALVLR